MITRSRIFALVLLLPFGSHVLGADGNFFIVPAQVNSFYEYCAYPLCDPARGSISGEFDDGKTISFIRNENTTWYMTISGFTSNPGNYFDVVGAWCDNPPYYQDVYPITFNYNATTGVLTVYLGAQEPASTCWVSPGGPNAPYQIAVNDY